MRFFLALFLSLFLIPAFNYRTDMFRAFHAYYGGVELPIYEHNERMAKTNYLEQSCERYDTYIFGDSRSEAINLGSIAARTGLSPYNFGVPSDQISTIEQKIVFLLRRHCPVKKIILFIQLDPLKITDMRTEQHDLLKIEHPEVGGYSPLTFLGLYLNTYEVTVSNLQAIVPHARIDNWYRYYPNGQRTLSWSVSPADYQKVAPVPINCGDETLKEQMQYHARIAKLARDNHIDVITVIMPWPKDAEAKSLGVPFARKFLAALEAAYGRKPIVRPENAPESAADWHDVCHFKTSLFTRIYENTLIENLKK